MEIHPAARKHGIPDEAIRHAFRNALCREPQMDDTLLPIGPDPSGTLLEILTIERDDGSELAIHAMPMRRKYLRLLSGDAQ